MNLSKKIFESCIPRSKQLFFRFAWNYLKSGLDEEMFYLNKLIKKHRRFLDIGANVGLYSYYFSRKFEVVEAFEPLPELTYRLQPFSKKIHVHNVALSNLNGSLDFYIPKHRNILQPPLASLEPRGGDFEKRIVDVVNLDSYQFQDVDLIKIDVEGHEFKVLEGGVETIGKCKPIIIVEIEQRHIAVNINVVFDYVLQLGYDGFFLNKGSLNPLRLFSYSIHQEPYLNNVYDKRYINNFIFLPKASF